MSVSVSVYCKGTPKRMLGVLNRHGLKVSPGGWLLQLPPGEVEELVIRLASSGGQVRAVYWDKRQGLWHVVSSGFPPGQFLVMGLCKEYNLTVPQPDL